MYSVINKDNRRFKRYNCNKEIRISFKDKIYNLQAINYSLNGIGLYFPDESIFINTGTQVHLKIDDLGIDDEGQIIWIKKVDSKLRAGIERKTISGYLSVFSPGDILLDLNHNKKNGILEVTNDKINKRIFFKEGDIIFATSNKTEESFVEVMLKTGRITDDQYYQLIDFSEKTGKSHGAALLELGYLKPDKLTSAIKDQVKEIIADLFKWEEARFIFLEEHLLPDKFIKLKMDIADIIYSGCKRISNIMYLKKFMPLMDAILLPSHNLTDFTQNINLDQTDKDVMNLINGERSMQEIINISPYDKQNTMKSLFALISTRIIRVKESEPLEDNTYKISDESTIDYDQEFVDKVEAIYQKLNSIDYYSLLGVERWATLDKIKKAYYAIVKEFHPDIHKALPNETLKNKLNTIFASLTEAYKILSQSNSRIQYDQKLANSHIKTKISNKDIAREKYNKGKLAMNKGRYVDAKQLFEQAIYLDNTVSDYHFYLGLALSGDKKYNEAARIINKALELDPFNSEYLAELGHIFLNLGFTLRAKRTFEKAIKIDPKNGRAINGLRKIHD